MADPEPDGRRDSFVRRMSNAAVDMGNEALEQFVAQEQQRSTATVAPSSPNQTEKSYRVSDSLDIDSHSVLGNMVSTNGKSLTASLMAIIILIVLFEPLRHLSTISNLDLTSASVFVGMMGILLCVLLNRLNDKQYRNESKVTLPMAAVVSCLMLYFAGGNTGIYTVPLVFLMLVIQNSSKWIFRPKPRPNPVLFFLKYIPAAVVFTIMCLLPQFMVAIPGLLLLKYPKSYAAWCGVVSVFSIAFIRIIPAHLLTPFSGLPQLRLLYAEGWPCLLRRLHHEDSGGRENETRKCRAIHLQNQFCYFNNSRLRQHYAAVHVGERRTRCVEFGLFDLH
jgi:hypothetical protein